MNFSVNSRYVFVKNRVEPIRVYYYSLTEIVGIRYQYREYTTTWRNTLIYSFSGIKSRLLGGTKMIFLKNNDVCSAYPFTPLKLYKNIGTRSLVCEKLQLNIKNFELLLPKQKSNNTNILLKSKANIGVPI